MKTGKYVLKELFLNRNIEQIIIPEIQRDYVWQDEQVVNLLKTIYRDYMKFSNNKDFKNSCIEDKTISEMFEEFYKKQKYSSNIGFIYAYDDKEYKDKYFLIDGQQRLTTMYLVLFALYNLIGKKEDFIKRYFQNKTLKLDYKVRMSSHEFLLQFITEGDQESTVKSIKDSYWYFNSYESDVSIQSIINNYITILEYIKGKKCEEFLEYVENYVEFWFFDTNQSEQGEELYLFMNSRGEAMQGNENIKALLLEDIDTDEKKNVFGKKWEDWQHFFWINKGDNENADKGFNEFLKWVIIIEYFRTNEGHYTAKDEVELKKILSIQSFTQYKDILTLQTIEKHFNVLGKLNNYNLIDKRWLNGGIKDIISYMEIIPLMHYAVTINNSEEEYRRFKRFYHNCTRFVDIAKNPDTYILRSLELTIEFLRLDNNKANDILNLVEIKSDRYKNILTEEERYKLHLYKKSKNREEIEKSFWEVEDNKYLDGEIMFLLNCIKKDNFDLVEFEKYAENFLKLFIRVDDKLRRALLTYGDYSFKDGWTYDYPRYSFEITPKEWRIKKSDELKKCTAKLLDDIVVNHNTLTDVIASYTKDVESWIYQFIKYDQIFAYTDKKRITFDGDKPIHLLKKLNAQGKIKRYDKFITSLKGEK